MPKILIIDDNRLNLDIVEHYLSFEGYEVLTAVDGEEGIRLIDEFKPELVITDIIMPGKDGVEVVLHSKYHHPEIKIIVLTSSGKVFPKDHLSMIIGLGAETILTKPFTRREIVSAVSYALKKEYCA